MQDDYGSVNEANYKLMMNATNGFEPIVMSLEGLEINDTTNDACKRVNDNLDFTYLSSIDTDFIPPDASTNINSLSNFVVLTSIYMSIQWLLILCSIMDDAIEEIFEVTSCRADQKSIIFGRV